MFVDEFGLNTGKDLILNAHGEELPAWKWISGKNFTDMASYPLSSNDVKMYARMSRSGKIISVEGSFPDCLYECRNGYVCEHEGVSRCGVRSNSEIVVDDNCYIFHHDEYLNWFEAYNECERNNGRLATFRNLKRNEPQIVAQLNQVMNYWIGLNRYEWRWIDSGKLIPYTNFGSYPFRGHSCLAVDTLSRKILTLKNCTKEPYKFICIRDTTKCASNPCRNGETCVGSIHNHSCECIEGGQCQTVENKCDSNPCRNGGTCYDYVNDYTCQCSTGYTGSHCETNFDKRSCDPCQYGAPCVDDVNNYTCLCGPGFTESQYQMCSTQETPASDMMKAIVIVQAVVIIIISAILLVVCIRMRSKTMKSNDAKLASRYETRNTSVLDNHVYSDIYRYDNIGSVARQPVGQESSIYEQIV